MAGNGNTKKPESGLKSFVKSLMEVSPATVAKLGREKGFMRRKKKKVVPKKTRPTGNIEKEKKVRGDRKAQRSFHKFIESELESQNPKKK